MRAARARTRCRSSRRCRDGTSSSFPTRTWRRTCSRRRRSRSSAWDGNCYVHHQITPEQILAVKKGLPHVKVLAHPECRADVLGVADAVLSTSGMVKYAKESDAHEFLIVTECGLSDRLFARGSGEALLQELQALCVHEDDHARGHARRAPRPPAGDHAAGGRAGAGRARPHGDARAGRVSAHPAPAVAVDVALCTVRGRRAARAAGARPARTVRGLVGAARRPRARGGVARPGGASRAARTDRRRRTVSRATLHLRQPHAAIRTTASCRWPTSASSRRPDRRRGSRHPASTTRSRGVPCTGCRLSPTTTPRSCAPPSTACARSCTTRTWPTRYCRARSRSASCRRCTRRSWADRSTAATSARSCCRSAC